MQSLVDKFFPPPPPSVPSIASAASASASSSQHYRAKHVTPIRSAAEDSQITLELIPAPPVVVAAASASASQLPPRMPALRLPFIVTSPDVTVISVKRYVCSRLGLPASEVDDIELVCNGLIQGNEHSLRFIRKTRWHTPGTDLVLGYRRKTVHL